MPTFILYANTDKPNKEQSDFIHQQASEILAHEIGKSKDFVMTFLQFGADLKFGSSDEPCAYAEVKNAGELSSECTSSISSALAELIEKALHAPQSRFYLEFQEAERRLWAWSGKTFG